ncbi:ABC transporter ATP-binding protein [Caldovatus aquaticus]|uniref:ATP-binding cassette domain-containing protein n=1 Tax=Caldovatus aquaticus TaxID=2865671 RepID=A0ABS7F291_9PROT|nr:ATP-binding cassette domain-containing protein [Caldovatus aquaticus]MBW8269633.1 ATP-binding cassette domain-containing protein [Caldovatus aquaticus]
MSPPLLETYRVGRRYGDFVALRDVTLRVHPGETVAIVGPNGAGKTTLVNVLTGLLRPSEGWVRFLGSDIAGAGPVRLAQLGMARAFQLVQVFPELTAAETIAVGALAQAGRGRRMLASLGADRALRARVEEVAAVFGLGPVLHRPARELSQGQKKLLDVASAFALRPTVILLDEPTSGVATADKHGIMATLTEAARRAGVQALLLVEHDIDLVETYATRVVGLRGGEVLADLPVRAFFADEEVTAALVGRRPARGAQG